MSYIPRPQEIYKHFKGNLYQITAIAEHSETGEQLVIYQALYGDFKTYARPLSMFMEKVDREKYPDARQEFRFELQGKDRERTRERKAEPEEVEQEEIKPEGTRSAKADEEEPVIDPLVLEFLDADTYEQRLNILAALHHRITDEMITTMAIACDVEVNEGRLEERYDALKNCLLTMEKYECRRLH